MLQHSIDRFRMDNRVVIITGGAGFLGIQHAEAILEAGGTPVIFDRTVADLERSISQIQQFGASELMTVVCDITDEESISGAMSKVKSRFGRIDAVVNNAAYQGRPVFGERYFAPVDDYPTNAWRLALDTTLTGTFLVTKHALRYMIEQADGVFVNVASDVGVISPDPRIYEGLPKEQYFNTPPSYAAAKAAIISFTRYIATHYALKNIRANSISPAGMFNDQPPEFVNKLTQLIPLGRMAKKGEYKSCLVFLLSDASSFITGANLIVDGGRTAW